MIRPGAANEHRKVDYARRVQGIDTDYGLPHPSLAACVRSTYGIIVYEEQVLQICETFAGMPPGIADALRRALVKQRWDLVAECGKTFYAHALRKGRTRDEAVAVWKYLLGFNGYAFCKAHSTAYGVEAYQGAWLKRYHPVEFMAAVLSNGKGFYSPLVYTLECYRLGIQLLPIGQPVGPHIHPLPRCNPSARTKYSAPQQTNETAS